MVETNAFLIVCSDERSKNLAQVLGAHGTVFRRRRASAGPWRYAVFKDGDWKSLPNMVSSKSSDGGSITVPNKDIPTKYLATFFHMGKGDPGGLPKTSDLGKIFAFSGGGVGSKQIEALGIEGVPIARPFREGWSVLQPRDVAEFLSFAHGESDRIPAFCEADKSFPALTALAILCQAFVSAGVASGNLAREHPLAVRVGWAAMPFETQKALGERLQRLWPKLSGAAWWRESFASGEPSDESFQRYLEQLCYDCGIDLDVKEGERTVDSLMSLLKSSTAGGAVAPLFGNEKVTIEVVSSAYAAIAERLEHC